METYRGSYGLPTPICLHVGVGSQILTMSSSSTGAPIGSSATPTADRACAPACPNMSPSSSDAPLSTAGCAVNPDAEATNPTIFTTLVTASRPTRSSTAASALSTQIRASSRPRAVSISTPSLPVAATAPSTSGSWPAVKTSEPQRTAGTYTPAGEGTGGNTSPSSVSRADQFTASDA